MYRLLEDKYSVFKKGGYPVCIAVKGEKVDLIDFSDDVALVMIERGWGIDKFSIHKSKIKKI